MATEREILQDKINANKKILDATLLDFNKKKSDYLESRKSWQEAQGEADDLNKQMNDILKKEITSKDDTAGK